MLLLCIYNNDINQMSEITITVPTPTKKRVYKSRKDMTPEQLQRRRELDAKWRETNREEANRRSRECEKKRYNENAEFKELKILQGRVRHAEKAVGSGYTSSSGQST
jgi:hypothetical protein